MYRPPDFPVQVRPSDHWSVRVCCTAGAQVWEKAVSSPRLDDDTYYEYIGKPSAKRSWRIGLRTGMRSFRRRSLASTRAKRKKKWARRHSKRATKPSRLSWPSKTAQQPRRKAKSQPRSLPPPLRPRFHQATSPPLPTKTSLALSRVQILILPKTDMTKEK